MAALQTGWTWYQEQLTLNPVRTQLISSGILWAAGDVIAQKVESAVKRPSNPNASSSLAQVESEGLRRGAALDWRRVAICSSYGSGFVGPIGHFWYEGLDYFVKHKLQLRPNSFKFIGSKLIADGFLFGPIHLVAFFIYMGLTSGRTIHQLKQDLKRDFIPAFMAEGAVWPIVQVTNFRFVPVRHQLLVVNGFCLLDSAFLSWFKHQDDAPWKRRLQSLVLPAKNI